MLLGITAYFVVLYTTSTSTVDIVFIVSISVILDLFEISSSVILKDPNHSDNISI